MPALTQQLEPSSHVCIHINNENLATHQHLLRTPSRKRSLEQRVANIEHQEDERSSSDMCGRMIDRRRSRPHGLIDMDVAVDDDDSPRISRYTAATRSHERRLTRAPKMPRFESRCIDILLPRLEPCRKAPTQPELLVCSMVNVVS